MEESQANSQSSDLPKIIIGIIVILVVAVGGYYFFKKGYSTPSNSPDTSSVLPTQEPQTPETENQVTIQNFSFNPSSITVKTGTTITWINQDDAPHTVVSVGDQKELNSESLGKGQSYAHTFNSAGEFNYQCSIHPSMQGKVTVTP